ncbi:MAG TPA: hypothetical protein VMR25_14625 [Planctomycetaceae bacterium]|nr:hypothetical protein [Planctomycetaceae bacterium]
MPQIAFSPSKEVRAWLKAGAKAQKRSVSAFVQLTLESSRLLEQAAKVRAAEEAEHRRNVYAGPIVSHFGNAAILPLRSVPVPGKGKRKLPRE